MSSVKLTSWSPSLLQPYVHCKVSMNCKTKQMTTGYCTTKTPPSLRIGFDNQMYCGVAFSSNDSIVVVDDVSLYNEKIKVFVDQGLFEDAITMYIQILEYGLPVESFKMFPRLIKSFGAVGDVEKAKQMHAHALKLGRVSYISVANSILAIYWKCKAAINALHLVDIMLKGDSVSWSTMISGFCQNGNYVTALTILRNMLLECSLILNRVACVSVLSSCASIGNLVHGQEIHGYLLRHGILLDEFLLTGLIDMYIKCGNVRSAKRVFSSIFFNRIVKNNSALWNAIIFGYVSNGCMDEAVVVLIDMRVNNLGEV